MIFLTGANGSVSPQRAAGVYNKPQPNFLRQYPYRVAQRRVVGWHRKNNCMMA